MNYCETSIAPAAAHARLTPLGSPFMPIDPAAAPTTRRLLLRLGQLAWKYRLGCAQLLALQLVVLTLTLATFTALGLAVDVVRQHAAPGGPPLNWPAGLAPPADWSPRFTVAALAAAMLTLAAARGVANYWYARVAARFVHQRMVVDLRALVYEKLQRLSFRFFADHHSGSIIGRVTADVQSLRVFVDGVVLQALTLGLSLAFYLAYMLRIHVGLTLLCLASTPVMWAISASFSRRVKPAYAKNRELFDQMLLALTENVRGVQVVKGFARHDEERAKFARANRAVTDQQHWIFWRVSLFSPTIELLTQFNLVALLGYGGYLVMQGDLALGSGLIVFSNLLQQFSGQVSKVTSIVNSVQQSLIGARRVFEVLDAPIEIQSPAHPRPLGRARGEIEFEFVEFRHQAQPVLADIGLWIPAGQCVALLGATGAGKSSLLNLIPRYFDATGGRVLIDGIDVRELDVDELRRNIGVVPQETTLFGDTVAANIAFGKPDASREQIERAARIAQAHDFIVALPDGYDTVLKEGGKDLSGGQRQRLAIARALLLEPPILLLDDPTAAIDPQTEDEILQAMEQAMAGRTTLVVAHRLSTLRRADLVVVLDGGRIVELGTHEQLMRGRGLYWRAASLQSDGQVIEDAPLRLPAHDAYASDAA